MGYFRHHTIIVTSLNKKHVETAHGKAVEVFNTLVSQLIKGVANAQYTFFVAPDGSKEFWDISDQYDEKRKSFIKYMEESQLHLDYVELSFGDKYGKSNILSDSRNKSEDDPEQQTINQRVGVMATLAENEKRLKELLLMKLDDDFIKQGFFDELYSTIESIFNQKQGINNKDSVLEEGDFFLDFEEIGGSRQDLVFQTTKIIMEALKPQLVEHKTEQCTVRQDDLEELVITTTTTAD